MVIYSVAYIYIPHLRLPKNTSIAPGNFLSLICIHPTPSFTKEHFDSTRQFPFAYLPLCLSLLLRRYHRIAAAVTAVTTVTPCVAGRWEQTNFDRHLAL